VTTPDALRLVGVVESAPGTSNVSKVPSDLRRNPWLTLLPDPVIKFAYEKDPVIAPDALMLVADVSPQVKKDLSHPKTIIIGASYIDLRGSRMLQLLFTTLHLQVGGAMIFL
jgi:hypothetical protein